LGPAEGRLRHPAARRGGKKNGGTLERPAVLAYFTSMDRASVLAAAGARARNEAIVVVAGPMILIDADRRGIAAIDVGPVIGIGSGDGIGVHRVGRERLIRKSGARGKQQGCRG